MCPNFRFLRKMCPNLLTKSFGLNAADEQHYSSVFETARSDYDQTELLRRA